MFRSKLLVPFVPFKNFSIKHQKFFHLFSYLIDPETNETYLDRRRQKALKEALDDYEVTDGIIKALPSLALRFPQRRINESHGLCNETLYVNFSLVFVYGVMCFE